ncbi:MAG: FIST N-terminal domain-containing protein [Cyanobacteriota bacterium]|nr:FIST N-terminal domain-containing protein [Cyanobacteriota bacterium]
MQWINVLSTQPSLESALREVVEQAQKQMQAEQRQPVLAGAGTAVSLPATPTRPDLAILFVSGAFASEYSRVMPLLQELLDVEVLIGGSGGGVIGAGQEVEDSPAISLSLAYLPHVRIQPFHLEAEQLPDLDAPPDAWIERIGLDPFGRGGLSSQPNFILLADGFSSNISDLLRGLDFAYPAAVKVGGLVSGGRAPGENALFFKHKGDYQRFRTGTVGVALAGNLRMDAVVAQGCRPIGHPLQVTDSENNIILKLADRPPLEVLQALVADLSPSDQKLVRHSLFMGVLMNEFKGDPEPGDFLIRVLMGIDPTTGAMAIGDRIRPGQTIQFHLRDAQTSAEDLEWVLSRYRDAHLEHPQPLAALMFACLGRGYHLYQQANFDSKTFRHWLGSMPLSGFFCNGEIGPVGDTTFLHGYTSAFAILRPAI